MTVASVRLQVSVLDYSGRLGVITVRWLSGGSSGPIDSLERLGERILEQHRTAEISRNTPDGLRKGGRRGGGPADTHTAREQD